jgi:asparagine synthase (glutamine-hydrolysing)
MGADLATWLPDDLLVKFDRMAMAHSLEGRAPYLTPRLAALALQSARPGQRLSLGDSKLALRRVARRWLPRDILERPKQGFVLPMRRWLTQWFAQRGGVAACLEGLDGLGVDARQAVALVEQDLAAGLQRERLLFALIMLAEWRRASPASRLRRAGDAVPVVSLA